MGRYYPEYPRRLCGQGRGLRNLAVFHAASSGFLIGDLLHYDYPNLVIGMVLMISVICFGFLPMYLVKKAKEKESEQYASYSYRTAVAYLCFSVGVVFISWTYLIGYAFLSLVYLAESAILLVIAWRTARELRQ